MNLFNYFTPKSETFYINANSTIRQALEKFDTHKFSVVPLIDSNGMYVSTVSEGDILRYIKNDAHFDITIAEHTPIAQIEKYRPYKPCHTGVSTERVIELALEQNFVPLIDDRGVYIGIVKRKTILEYLRRQADKK